MLNLFLNSLQIQIINNFSLPSFLFSSFHHRRDVFERAAQKEPSSRTINCKNRTWSSVVCLRKVTRIKFHIIFAQFLTHHETTECVYPSCISSRTCCRKTHNWNLTSLNGRLQHDPSKQMERESVVHKFHKESFDENFDGVRSFWHSAR